MVRRCLIALVALLALTPAAARAAATPVDGQWRPASEATRFLAFDVKDGGRTLDSTLASVGSLIDPCGWTGPWSAAPTVAIRNGTFTATQTGAADVDPTQIRVDGVFTSPTTAILTFTIHCTRAEGPGTETYTVAATTDAPPPTTCGSAREVDGTLHLGASGAARAHPGRYGLGGAFAIRRRGLDCSAVSTAMGALLGARDESTALGGLGLVATKVTRSRFRHRRAYTVKAVGAGGSLSYRRVGAPRIDHSIFRAGQHIDLFATNDTHEECTAAFAASVPGLPGPVGLTAAHCIGVNPDRIPVLRGFGSGPKPLGHELTPTDARPGGRDAGYFSILFKWGVAQQIERGERMPLTVTGTVAEAAAGPGTKVCFAGRRSGADRCGRVVERGAQRHPELRCTDIPARQGDSGGPVYLDPGARLTTRAVGLVAVITGPLIRIRGKDTMCFTPIEPALAALGATLPPGPGVRGPMPDAPPGDF